MKAMNRYTSSQRRSNIEIIADILRIAEKGAGKTRIVYGANLNFKMLNDYVAKLERGGLIRRPKGSSGPIQTIGKGKEYLEWFRRLREFR